MKTLWHFKKAFCVICLLITSFIYAHGDLTKRIESKTQEISKDSKNPQLYFERGYLYEQHEEYKKALSDYLKSEELGNTTGVLHYRIAQTYYNSYNFSEALRSSKTCLEINSLDVKINKLHAQILIQQGDYLQALTYYDYFIENTIDIYPDDIIEYSKIFLAIDKDDYTKAIEKIDTGLDKLGKDTFSLQLTKLEYLKASKQLDRALEQYNYFILSTNRNEFWYYKKAKYLFEQQKYQDSKIALQQAKTAIVLLNDKFQNTSSIKILKTNIINLENML